jgi:hypothetical protein
VPELDALLANAAGATNWERMVVRRCAWCQRVADRAGVYRTAILTEPATVFTDGMCPECGAAALARVGTRAGRAA